MIHRPVDCSDVRPGFDGRFGASTFLCSTLAPTGRRSWPIVRFGDRALQIIIQSSAGLLRMHLAGAILKLPILSRINVHLNSSGRIGVAWDQHRQDCRKQKFG
jgi:hypothetical protein